ncbi:hypothetical protein PAHAL_6G004800 [Panicum hallii]|jgi:hypothetical protein|uniref:SMP domain-containing protein n=1 Tax=Panicum hallii TaxID=206008 RepID=A0A2S3HZH6_9POAL|nr:uncharacterized protein LOC112897571 [Panicum hallii]PAN33229.1 hypothetical protein PAHAL_6G004800 [Panicum hallii]
MAQSERRMKHGTAQTKVAGDDEMLRTGFHNGTPLEAGKVADSQPVDLFAPAHRIPSQQQQQEADEAAAAGRNSRVIAESEPVDLPASARGLAEANEDKKPAQQGRQGMADQHAAWDARLN